MSIRLSRPHHLWAWMVPWLLPLGVLGTVALISLSNLLGYVLVLVWGWVLFPYGAAYIRSHARTAGAHEDGSPLGDDDDVDYWRTKLS
jgi:hypothetical protein